MMFSDFWQPSLPLLALALGFAAGWGWRTRRQRQPKGWPRDFKLNARPVFTTEERLLFRELKAALPQHVVLAKLNLLRFCQTANEHQARWWFDRLHALNVTFAVCTPNGAVISVIDLEAPQRSTSARGQRLKEAVLEACRIRYIRCQPGHWPRPALLAQWALGGPLAASATLNTGAARTSPGQAAARGPAQPAASPLVAARAELAQKLHQRRAERASRFQDSGFASDSFFALDSRFDDAAANSAPAPFVEPVPHGTTAGMATGTTGITGIGDKR
ncbi:MAG TPA: DUF2726 domain-containing protein [Candidatus Aquabacterium excrementipullorum]|nr:DUF2726 domain-containing protein [Candidatus Aquabacterium excrementipullorum]